MAWFELSRVKLYINDLKENKDYFDVAGGSSYGEFELPRVKLQYIFDGNPGDIDRLWFELARGSF